MLIVIYYSEQPQTVVQEYMLRLLACTTTLCCSYGDLVNGDLILKVFNMMLRNFDDVDRDLSLLTEVYYGRIYPNQCLQLRFWRSRSYKLIILGCPIHSYIKYHVY